MHRCFVDKAWIDAWLIDRYKVVPDEVRERLLKVVRIKENEHVALFDGQGREYSGLLSRGGVFSEHSYVEAEPDAVNIVLLQAAIDEAKLQETIKRGTEFGVGRFIIFKADRSDTFCFGKLEKRHERLKSLAIDAARQSGRLFVPELSFVSDMKACFLKAQFFGIFGDLRTEEKLSKTLASHYANEPEIAVTVGPEGGLTEHEKNILITHNFKSVQWAPYTLRSELASLSAIAIINAFLGKA